MSSPVERPRYDILLVEDDADFREFVADRFRDRGDAVRFAEDAVEARAQLAQGLPDVVLLDLELPGTSGLELLTELAQPEKRVPVPFMVLSGHDGPDVRARAFFAGAAGFVSKRSGWRELQIQVEACVQVARSQWRPAEEAKRSRLTRLARLLEVRPSRDLEASGLAHAWQRSAGDLSGDLLAFRAEGPAGCSLLLGDASGHDVAAGILATFLAGVFEAAQDQAPGPRRLLDRCDQALSDLLDHSEFFATAVAAELDPVSRVLRVANAGHPPAILLRRRGDAVLLTEGGLPLGMGPHLARSEAVYPAEVGDRLVVYTDGLLDEAESPEATARNRRSLHELVTGSRGTSSQALLGQLVELVTSRADAPDDASVVVLEVPDAAPWSGTP